MEDELRTVFESRDGFLYDVLRYHMGWVDQQGQPQSGSSPLNFQSALALASCDALGGDYRKALPLRTLPQQVPDPCLSGAHGSGGPNQ